MDISNISQADDNVNLLNFYKILAANSQDSETIMLDNDYNVLLCEGSPRLLRGLLPDLKPQSKFLDLLKEDRWSPLTSFISNISADAPPHLDFGLDEKMYKMMVIRTNTEGSATPINLLVVRDTTKELVLKREVERHIEQLNRTNRELEQFAYFASHDLQEPLRKIMSFSDRLTSKFEDTLGNEGKLFLSRIQAATQRMQVLIDDLLTFSRTNRESQAFETTDLNDVLKIVLKDLDLLIETKKAEIIAETLPTLNAVNHQMVQLFTNLIANALKFSKETIPPVVNISYYLDEDINTVRFPFLLDKAYYHITVKDNGIGFDDANAERIFLIFQRLHGRTEYSGTGVGLAICKKIIENHKGAIYAESEIDKGSIFHILLPTILSA